MTGELERSAVRIGQFISSAAFLCSSDVGDIEGNKIILSRASDRIHPLWDWVYKQLKRDTPIESLTVVLNDFWTRVGMEISLNTSLWTVILSTETGKMHLSFCERWTQHRHVIELTPDDDRKV